VLDTRARTPAGAALIGAGAPERALIVVGDQAPAERVRALEEVGATLLRVDERHGHVALDAALAALWTRDVRAVLVEGGGEVHDAFLGAGLVDRVAIFVAPRLLGGRGAPTLVAGAGRPLKDAIRLGPLAVRPVGEDLLIEADVVRER
jgi:diaminohydroxyphosphoribosylaminopyrimidine deaminase/5-amino-6-(5-phosphoribosylamino)uracil reductase